MTTLSELTTIADLTEEIERLKSIIEALESVLSEEGMRESLCSYNMGVELINRLEKYKGGRE